MIVAMGVYQGLNPEMGWLYAVARALERRSVGAALRGTTALAVGHYIAMLSILLPVAIVAALIPETLMAIRPWLGAALIGFGLFKLFRPSHPRFVARIPPSRPVVWSYAMAMTHCGSPIMMLAPLTSLLMLLEFSGQSTAHGSLRAEWFTVTAVAVPAAMASTLLLTASFVAVLVYRQLGLAALTRFWIDLDLGWAAIFVLMGVMAFLM